MLDSEMVSLWRLLGGLICTVALIPLAGLAIKRLRREPDGELATLRVRERLPLGPGVSLVRVESDECDYLLSVTQGKVQLIDRMNRPMPMLRPVPIRGEVNQ